MAPGVGGTSLAAGVALAVVGGGGGVPVIVKSICPAHLYEIGSAVSVSTIKMGAVQRPMTLCQFQSRALASAGRRMNQIERRSPLVRHFRGHQR